MSKRYFILGLCMLFIQAFAQIVYAQNARTVTGVVVDEFGDPIIGAAIKIVDSTVGTISDIDGKFSRPGRGKIGCFICRIRFSNNNEFE